MIQSAHFRLCSTIVAAAFSLAACGGGSGSTSAQMPSGGLSQKSPALSTQELYVANPDNVVTVYPSDSTGNVAPVRNISGPLTKLALSTAIGVDQTGEIFVGNTDGVVTVYGPEANGNVIPSRTLPVRGTGFGVDSGNRVYISDFSAISVFASNSNTLVRRISGPETGLSLANGSMAIDASGRLYVANQAAGPCGSRGSITIYAANASGNAAPIASLSGDKTGIGGPLDVALDAAGNIYVNSYIGAGNIEPGILVFSPGSQGNVPPIARITATSRVGLALDANGNIYSSDQTGAGAIFVYPPLADLKPDGSTAPIRVISGSNTHLFEPQFIAIR
jgi:hypothetical protein